MFIATMLGMRIRPLRGRGRTINGHSFYKHVIPSEVYTILLNANCNYDWGVYDW